MTRHPRRDLCALIAACVPLAGVPVARAAPADLLAGYRSAAQAEPSAERGQRLFNATHGREWSCASCHGAPPVAQGKHASTGKPIAPLAPVANAERFTDRAKAEKWFRRNCKDVMGRECSAGEKADVLAFLLSLQR